VPQPLNPEQIQDIKDTFALFDTDGNGSIDSTELKVAVRALNLDPANEGLKNMIGMIGGDGSNGIDMNEFMNLMTSQIDQQQNSEAHIMEMFRVFDEDETGRMSFKNLKRVATEIGENLTDEELQEMLDEADREGNGEVNMDEFFKIMKGQY